MTLTTISPKDVHRTIADNDGLLLVNFSLPLLYLCEFFRRELQDLAPQFDGTLRFSEVVLPYRSALVNDFELEAIPTLMLFRGPEEVERVECCWSPDILFDFLATATSYYGESKNCR